MAGNIKGITIEIDGNTKKLNSALKSVNQDLKDTQYKLKDVEKALKLDPKNTELLQQKFKLLGDSVNEAKEKVKLLEEAERQAAEQVKNGQLGQEDYDALVLKLQAARTEVEKLEKAYNDFGSVSAQKIAAAGKQVEEFGGKLSKVGDGLTKGVTAPLAAIGGVGIAAFKELDAAMDTVATKTGAAGDELKEYQDIAKEIAETIPTDFQTAADAVGEVQTRFNADGDALQWLSQQFVEFASITNTDVTTAVDSVQSVMAAWGVDLKDSGLLLDTLAKAGQDTGVSVDTLAQNLAANKTALDEMGFSLSDSTMFLANLDKNGVDAGAALAGLKKALVNASKEGKTSKEVLGELQDTIKNGATDTEAYQAAMELFGAKAGPAIADAVKEGRLSFEELGTSLEDFAGTTENTFNETLDPIDQLTTAMNTAKDVGAQLGASILTVLTPALQKLNDFVKVAKDRWDKLSPKTKDAIVKFGLIAAAIGPVLSVGGRLISGIGKLMSLGPKLASAISFLLSPFGLVVAAIAAVIAIGVLLYKNWDTIKAKAQQLGQSISNTWNNVKTWTVNTWNNIKAAVSGAVDAVKNKISTGWGNLKQNVSNTFSGIKNAITAPFDTARNLVSQAIQKIKNLFPIRLGNIFSGIKLPHFSISGGRLPWGIGGRGTPPSISVQWYKKAYDNAVMFNDPTVLSTTNGYKGFGDGNGSEMVIGKDYLLNMIREAIGGSQLARNMGAVGQILEVYLPEIASKEMRVSGQDLVYANSQNINRTLGAETVLTGRGVR